MNKVTILLLCAFLFGQSMQVNAQPFKISSVYDSLQYLLTYFHENTNDTGFKQAIEKAQALDKDPVTDSFANQLISVENLLLSLEEDSAIMNRHPFKEQMIFSLGKTLVQLFQPLPPRKENLFYAAALNNLGVLYENKLFHSYSDDKKASALFEEALAIRKKILGKNNPDYAESLNHIAVMYERKGDKAKAKFIILQALAIRKKILGENNFAYADNLFYLAEVCRALKQYDTAILLFDQQINIRKKISGEENSRYALYLYHTSDMMIYLWQYQKVFTYCTQALDITKRTLGKENIQYAYCLEGLASYYYNVAEYEKAIPLYLQSFKIKERLYGSGCKDNALTLHNLATTYFRMGKYEQAIPCLQQVISIQKKVSEVPEYYAYELNWQALLYKSIGNYDKALSLYQQALKIKEYRESVPRYAGTLNNMAALYESLNKNKQAVFYLEKARSIIGNYLGEQSPDYANILLTLSALYEKLSRHNTAMPLCRAALSIRKKIYRETHPQYAAALAALGTIYMQTRKFDSSALCFTQALSIQKNVLGEKHPDHISSLNNLALLQLAQKKNNDAVFTIIKANQLELKYIARTYTSLSEQEKIEFEKNQYYQFSYLPSLIYKNNIKQPQLLQQVYANELALKGMVLNDQQSLLNSIRKSNNKNAIDLYNEWRVNKIFIGKQLLQPIKERSNSLDSIKEATNQSEQQLSRISVAFRQQQENFTAKKISEKLLSNEAAIEFIKFQYYNKKFTDSIMYAAIIVLPDDSIPEFIFLFEEKQLVNELKYAGKNESAINRFYSGGITINIQLPNKGDALYKLIWKPLEKYLSGVNTVYYAPAGLLHRIAFAALPVDTSNHFLIDKYNLNQMLSTRSVASPSIVAQKPTEINIWGNINYDDEKLNANTLVSYKYDTAKLQLLKWPPLQETRFEINIIKNLFTNAGISNVSVITDTAATEEAFKALDEKSPLVLHIATHGFFWSVKEKLNNSFSIQQDAMFRSGLVLACGNNIWANKKIITGKEDGILTSYEIAQLNLSNTDIVVLSACETALGDLNGNEGVIGLQRAFKLAGVKQMIISLWRIPDKQTAELMSLFYKNWLDGNPPSEALHAAQLTMKAKYPPYDWAAFVLVE